MKTIPALLFLAFLLSVFRIDAHAQQPVIRKAAFFDKTPPLREMEPVAPGPRDRSWKDGIIRNEGSPRTRNDNPAPLPLGGDPVWQSDFGFRENPNEVANFEGIPNLNQVYPPDTDGDVGPDHYFQMINLSFQVFDKQGNTLYGPADNRTLWTGFIGPWTGTNDGDPIILYDELADRWVATQFAINTSDGTFWELIAITATGDPLGEWYRYAFQFPAFNDYPKMGVWPDGYYFSFNMFGADYRRAAVCVLERDAMLTGDPEARMILFDLPQGSEPWSLLPADFDGVPPEPGTPNYFAYAMDDAFGSGDYISIYAFTADWTDPLNSTFSEVDRLDTEPFNSFFCNASLSACLQQPAGGPPLEALSDRLMFRLQYRNFDDYETMVTNHTVNADGNGHAGIRWYELRNLKDGNGWFIHQQGTYAPDELHRWMGSIAMDGRGYIALGFSVVSPSKFPSIRYTGRSPNDPPGEMTFYEEEIIGGSGVQTGPAARWGDYSMMSVDPSNDSVFWFTTEYVEKTGQVSWQTRIAGFFLQEDNIAPAEVNDLEARANTTNSVTLEWTATGNDGNAGTAFLYDIRYAEVPITEENFDSAIPVSNAPKPGPAGTMEQMTVTGLDFGTEYHFAMKVRDRQFNFSGLSNVPWATTPGEPEIRVQEEYVAQKIFSGSAGARAFLVENPGASDIYLKIYKDTLGLSGRTRRLGDYADRSRVADPEAEKIIREALVSQAANEGRAAGDILATYTGAASAITGMAWVSGTLFMVDMQKDFLLKYDTAIMQLYDTVVIHDSPFGIAWDGAFLWIGDKTGNVFAYHTDGSPAGYSFSVPWTGFSSLAFDGDYFLANFILQANPRISRLDETGAVIGEYHPWIDNMNIWQLTFVPEHFDGKAWFTNNSGKIGRIRLDLDYQSELVQVFPAPAGAAYALAHDHNDLWYGKSGGTLYRIDDGVDEVNWMLVTPDTDTIAASGTSEMQLYFDATGFEAGNYRANIGIVSNDPAAPEIRIPVDLQVVSAIDLGADTSLCGNPGITLDAGAGFAGYLWSDGSQGQTLMVDSAGFSIGAQTIWVEVSDIGGATRRDSVSIDLLDCASIFEFPSGQRVSVYPNPSRGVFTLEVEGLTDRMEILISDMEGKVVFEHEMSSQGVQLIDISKHNKGQYMLRISMNGRIRVQKLLVN